MLIDSGDRFYGVPALIGHCQLLGWACRLRLKGNLRHGLAAPMRRRSSAWPGTRPT